MAKHTVFTDTRLYIVHCSGYFKIGIARNVVTRISGMQTGNPFPIDLVFETPCLLAAQRERFWHNEFRHVHHSGEWFRLSDADVKRIKKEESRRNRHVGSMEENTEFIRELLGEGYISPLESLERSRHATMTPEEIEAEEAEREAGIAASLHRRRRGKRYASPPVQ